MWLGEKCFEKEKRGCYERIQRRPLAQHWGPIRYLEEVRLKDAHKGQVEVTHERLKEEPDYSSSTKE